MSKKRNQIKGDHPLSYWMGRIIKRIGPDVQKILYSYRPDYVVPLESKGAFLLDLALESNMITYPTKTKLQYQRAFDFYSKEDLGYSKVLIIDDTFFSGRTLREAKKDLKERGVGNIKLLSLFDFTYLLEDKDIDKEVYKETIFPRTDSDFPKISHHDLIAHIQNEIITERMPSTFDHMIFEAGIKKETYESLMQEIGDTNRLLYYGKRGKFLTSSILLQDLVEGNWATPPKIRMWYNELYQSMRIAPIAFPARNFKRDHTKLSKLLDDIIVSSNEILRKKDEAEVVSFDSRIDLMKYIVGYLRKFNIDVHFQPQHLRRYYPAKVTEKLEDIIKKEVCSVVPSNLPALEDRSEKIIDFLPIVPEIIQILRHEYDSQIEKGIARKDCKQMGFTLNEIVEKIGQKYSIRQIHTAIDYCYDLALVSSFLREKEDLSVERAIRTTEFSYHINCLAPEAFAVALIYTSESEKEKIPLWLINKVYCIVERAWETELESLKATTGYHGDFNLIQASENALDLWSNFHSHLWEIGPQGKEDEQRLYLEAIKGKKEEAERIIENDPRLAQHQTKIDAIHWLCKKGGYDASVLMNILCDGYGGTTYLHHNLEQIIEKGIQVFAGHDSKNYQEYEDNCTGIRTKFRSLDNSTRLLEKLTTPQSKLYGPELHGQAKIIADRFLMRLKPLPKDNAIYGSFRVLYDDIRKIYELAETKDFKRIIEFLKKYDVEFSNEPMQAIQILRLGQQRLLKWIYGISGKKYQRMENKKIKIYDKKDMWVMAYDLTKSRRKIEEKLGVKEGESDKVFHSIMDNWIIAYNGSISKDDEEGDRKYGFFLREEDAVNTALWFNYHSNMLSEVNPFFKYGNVIAGLGIAKGEIEPDSHGNVAGRILNILGHQLKNELGTIADEIGARKGDPPVWIIEPYLFPITNARGMTGVQKEHGEFLIAPLINPINNNSLPWKC